MKGSRRAGLQNQERQKYDEVCEGKECRMVGLSSAKRDIQRPDNTKPSHCRRAQILPGRVLSEGLKV